MSRRCAAVLLGQRPLRQDGHPEVLAVVDKAADANTLTSWEVVGPTRSEAIGCGVGDSVFCSPGWWF